jgi:hypothetical protein
LAKIALQPAFSQIIAINLLFREFFIITYLLLLAQFHFAGGNDVDIKKLAIYVLLVLAALALILPVAAWWGGWGWGGWGRGLGWGGLGWGWPSWGGWGGWWW